MDTVVVKSTVTSECDVEAERKAVVKCDEIDLTAYTYLIQRDVSIYVLYIFYSLRIVFFF